MWWETTLLEPKTLPKWDFQEELNSSACLSPVQPFGQSPFQIKTSHTHLLESKPTSPHPDSRHHTSCRGDANASVYLTDSYIGVRSKPRAKQALLNRQAAPKGMRDSHPYKQSLKVSPLRKTSHSQPLPSHSALTNTPNSLEMPGIKHSPGPAHQRSI